MHAKIARRLAATYTVFHKQYHDGCRKHEVTISAFLAPQILLMSIPVIGPIIFVPMQGASAWLVDLLAKQSSTQTQAQPMQSMPGQGYNQSPATGQYSGFQSGRMAAPSNVAPTLPASAPVYPGQGSYQQPAYSPKFN